MSLSPRTLALLSLAACGAPPLPAPPPPSSPSTPAVGVETAGTKSSGVDVSAFSVNAVVGTSGGEVTLATSAAIQVPAGSVSAAVTLGIRPATAPALDAGRVLVGDAVEIAASSNDLTVANADAPLTLRFAAPLAAGQDSAKLQVVAKLADGALYPLDGSYDGTAKTFSVQTLGLPPLATYALTLLPSLTTEDEPAPARDWTRVNFSVDFDGNKISIDQVKALITHARTAAQTYSLAGLKEPFLYKSAAMGGVTRWHVHLVADEGSHFDPNIDTASPDAARHFGRLYVATGRLAAPKSDKLGSVLSSIAHEMFHSVFHSYKVPSLCFNYTKAGVTYCYQSYAGWNEGMATAVGYFIDQGRADPRPSEEKLGLKYPPGVFSSTAKGLAYRNQDFMVYVLRKGGLAMIRKMLDSLALTSGLADGMSGYDAAVRYHEALATGGIGQADGFYAFYGTYALDRAYMHTADGRIWPTDAATAMTLDPTLVAATHDVVSADCKTVGDRAECKVSVANACPLCGYAITVDMDKGGGVPAGVAKAPLGGKITSKSVPAHDVTLAAIGETGGHGVEAALATSLAGGPVVLSDLWSTYSDVTVLALGRGAKSFALETELAFAPADLSPACQSYADWMCQCGPGNRVFTELECVLAAGQICANAPNCDEACSAGALGYSNAHDDPDPTVWNEGLQCVHKK